MSRWNMGKERKRGGAIVASEIRLAERKIRIGPGRFEARSFPQFTESRLVLIGQQAAYIVLEGVQPQGALSLGEFRKCGAVRFIIFGEQAPDELGLHLHQRIEWARFADGRKQHQWIRSQHAGFDRQTFAVRSERAE